MKSIKTVMSAIALVMLFGFSNSNAEKNKVESISSPAFYPYGVLSNIMNCSPCSGVRFYNALYPADAPVTLMAVSVTRDADSKDALYHLYEGIVNNGALIVPLHKGDAKKSCDNLGAGNCFAVTFTIAELNSLLSEEGASGISFMSTTDERGNQTLTATPANIENNTIVPIPNARSITPTEPCPTSCGANPAASYLCNMTN